MTIKEKLLNVIYELSEMLRELGVREESIQMIYDGYDVINIKNSTHNLNVKKTERK